MQHHNLLLLSSCSFVPLVTLYSHVMLLFFLALSSVVSHFVSVIIILSFIQHALSKTEESGCRISCF
jgi:hypothetical protein